MSPAEPWTLFIDIEGFGDTWDCDEDRALFGMMALIDGIYRIGKCCFPLGSRSLLAYQYGDAFLISSRCHEERLDRAVAIAVALFQHVFAKEGLLCRAAIAEGQLSDVSQCMPRSLREASRDGHVFPMGQGLLVFLMVMGVGLIRPYKMLQAGPRGPLLLVEQRKVQRIGEWARATAAPGTGYACLDWLHALHPIASGIRDGAELCTLEVAEAEERILGYCQEHAVASEWAENARKFLHLGRS